MAQEKPPVRWRPNREKLVPPWAIPGYGTCMLRGARGLCPSCAGSRLFTRYLRVTPECSVCGAPLGSYPSDDMPPYITMLIVLHLMIPPMIILEETVSPPLWSYAAVMLPLAIILTLLLLQPVKGATVGLLLALDLRRDHPEPR